LDGKEQRYPRLEEAGLNSFQMEKKQKANEKEILLLQKGHQAFLDFLDKMERLIRIQEKIHFPSDIDQIWEIFLQEIQDLIHMELCALFLVEEESHEFVLRSTYPREHESICRKEIDRQIEFGIFSWIVNRGKPALIPSLVFKNKKTILMLPLSTVKKTLGVILILTSIDQSSITQENMKLLTVLGKECALVMENRLLYEDLKKEHESLKEAQAQIIQSERLAAVGRLTAGAFHEVLNPLNIISGYTQLILMDKELNPRFSKYLSIVRSQSDRIGKIVKGLLQFSRFPNPRRNAVQMNDLIRKVLSLFGQEGNTEHMEIIQELDPELPSILGDEEDLSQVLLNLLSNAIDAMPQGGTIKISTRLARFREEVSDESKFIEIRFKDTGTGISEENIDKIFDPFFTTKEAGNGTGLGLSLSYGIIQRHGGSIRANSHLNQGSEFTIYLPIWNKNI